MTETLGEPLSAVSDPAAAAAPPGAAKNLERLAALEIERKEEALKRREAAREQQDPRESKEAYIAVLQQQRAEWHEALCALEGGSVSHDEARQKLDALAAQVMEMEAAAASASYFLPAYDQRSIAASHREMHQQLEGVRKKLLPKKKFSFSSSRVTRKTAADKAAAQPAAADRSSAATDSSASQAAPVPEVLPGRGLQGLRNSLVVVGAERLGGSDYTLMDLEDCTVFLLGRMSALRCHKLSRCNVHCGPVAGSSFLDAIDRCVFHLPSHQVRVHSTTDTDLYLRVRSNPIIEHSKGIRVAPMQFDDWEGAAMALGEAGLMADDSAVSGKWQQVDDFGWLRAVQSPNWCVLPEDSRSGAESPPSDIAYDEQGALIVPRGQVGDA